MPKSDQISQEVRFAVVLYGGVSLAVYINGVVQELLRLVRSTSGISPLAGTEKVYRKLGCVLERGVIPQREAAEDAIRTKFKVDIISGTSAGGINGIFLAKALANESDLSPIQKLWFDEGAIESLLNDGASYAGVGQEPAKTESLLNSRRMYRKLLDAFDSMDSVGRDGVSQAKTDSRLSDEIDLFATTTDIEGIPVPIQLFDNVVFERRYRNAFHMRYAGGVRNDFQPDNNPFLAFASRCTSSFPFAFEPMQLCNIDEMLQQHPIYARKAYCLSPSTRWQKYYTNYLDGIFPGATRFPQRSFGDGGYLNNAPFSFAVEALLARQADVPVDRKLFYVEPSPAHPEEQAVRAEKPNAVENSVAALVTIPGYQTIRNDLMRVLDRNRAATRINKTVSEIEARIQTDRDACKVPAGAVPEIWFRDEACFRGYYQMRATEVTDELALMVARMRSIEEGSAHFKALRALVRAWRETEYHVDPRGGKPGAAGDGLTRFLTDFDLAYRLRRLRFVLRKLDTLYGLRLKPEHPSHRDALAALAFGLNTEKPPSQMPAELADARAAVAGPCQELRGIFQNLLQITEPEDRDTPVEGQSSVADPSRIVRDTIPVRDAVIAVLSKVVGMDEVSTRSTSGAPTLTSSPLERTDEEPHEIEALYDYRARGLVAGDEELLNALRGLGAQLRGLLAGVLEGAHRRVSVAFANGDAGRVAKRYYYCFDLFDSIQYPMTFGTDVGEADVVEIIRVCPEDAAALVPGAAERRTKLKGLVAGHFGAFLDRDWRVSDLLWGRLDAAERIITALLPWKDSSALRDRLIDQAHEEILKEFDAQRLLGDMAGRQALAQGPQTNLTPANILQVIQAVQPPLAPPTRDAHRGFMRLWGIVVPAEMDRRRLMETLARSTEIIGRMLDAIANGGALSKPAAWVANAGRAFWGVVEISVPRSALTLLGRYWQSLLFLIAALLILVGLVGGQTGVSGVGWACFAIATALFMVRTALGSFMRGGSVMRVIRAIAIVLCCVIFAAGGLTIYQRAHGLWDSAQRGVCRVLGTCSGAQSPPAK